MFSTFDKPPKVDMYDLSQYTWEMGNLSEDSKYSQLVNELMKSIEDWRISTKDPFLDSKFFDEMKAKYAGMLK